MKMKRSEIINLIANYFYENGVDVDESMEEADTLLTALEMRGMLPPVTIDDSGPFGIEYLNECITDMDMFCGWESEEENEDE
jgi:hypothetical protein